MATRLSATEAARRFSDLVNRVRYGREEFVIERGGKEVCRIGPVGPTRCTLRELARTLGSEPRPDEAYLDELEALTRRQPALPEPPWGR
jgi:antitoxin (DNA-binding transcriptional repressor) of toxin-antitoxin stability system